MKLLKLSLLALAMILSQVVSAYPQIQVGDAAQVSLGVGPQTPSGGSDAPSAAFNGRYLAFESYATNLVASDLNASTDIFLYDQDQGTTRRLSQSASGVEGNASSTAASVSAVAPDGFFAVAFQSNANNLGASITDSNANTDIYLALPTKNVVEPISIPPGGGAASGASSSPSVAVIPSPNRVLVAFRSSASNLVTGDTNSVADVFVASIPISTSGAIGVSDITISRIAPSGGAEPNNDSSSPAISGNGRYVAFASFASNFVSGVSLTARQIYRYDMTTGSAILVSRNIPGDGAANSDCDKPTISYDGRYIEYQTTATNVAKGGSLGGNQVIRYDADTGLAERVDTDSSGVGTSGAVLSAQLSANGRFVVFSSYSNSFVSGDTNSRSDVFIKDMETGEVARVSHGVGAAESNDTSDTPVFASPSFNASGGFCAYESIASNLTSSGFSSGLHDIFLNQITFPKRTLTPDTKLEVPPDVRPGKGRMRITAEKFSDAALSASAAGTLAIKLGITYEFQIRPVQNTGTRRNIVTKRNVITTQNVRPGNYKVNYRVIVRRKSNGRKVFQTKYSPKQRATVR